MHLLEWLGIAAGSLLAIGALTRALWRFNRRTVVIVEAVKELVPNGGSSMKDTVHRTEGKVDETARELSELKRRFEEHLAGDC